MYGAPSHYKCRSLNQMYKVFQECYGRKQKILPDVVFTMLVGEFELCLEHDRSDRRISLSPGLVHGAKFMMDQIEKGDPVVQSNELFYALTLLSTGDVYIAPELYKWAFRYVDNGAKLWTADSEICNVHHDSLYKCKAMKYLGHAFNWGIEDTKIWFVQQCHGVRQMAFYYEINWSGLPTINDINCDDE